MRLGLLASIFIPVLATGPATESLNANVATAADRCARLAYTRYPNLEILSANKVSSGPYEPRPGTRFELPTSCRVRGVARPTRDSQIGFELWLPDGWNGRFVQLGNGGFAGNIDHPSLANEIRRGNAAAMTDTGHKASEFDASWALGHPQKAIDYGYRSIKVTADTAQMVAQVPALIESLTGKNLHELMQQVRRIDSNNPPPVKAPDDVALGATGRPLRK